MRESSSNNETNSAQEMIDIVIPPGLVQNYVEQHIITMGPLVYQAPVFAPVTIPPTIIPSLVPAVIPTTEFTSHLNEDTFNQHLHLSSHNVLPNASSSNSDYENSIDSLFKKWQILPTYSNNNHLKLPELFKKNVYHPNPDNQPKKGWILYSYNFPREPEPTPQAEAQTQDNDFLPTYVSFN